MNGQIRGCPIQKTHVIVQPRNFDPIQKTHVKGGAAQLWGAPELIFVLRVSSQQTRWHHAFPCGANGFHTQPSADRGSQR